MKLKSVCALAVVALLALGSFAGQSAYAGETSAAVEFSYGIDSFERQGNLFLGVPQKYDAWFFSLGIGTTSVGEFEYQFTAEYGSAVGNVDDFMLRVFPLDLRYEFILDNVFDPTENIDMSFTVGLSVGGEAMFFKGLAIFIPTTGGGLTFAGEDPQAYWYVIEGRFSFRMYFGPAFIHAEFKGGWHGGFGIGRNKSLHTDEVPNNALAIGTKFGFGFRF